MKFAHVLRRKLGPAIAWAPAHDAYYMVASMRPGTADIPPLHVTQRALLQLHSQIERRGAALPFGLLSGALCLDPESGTHYLLIDEATAARRALTADEPFEQLNSELRALAAEAESHQKLVLGWYLGGMDDDLEVDPEVMALHHQLFGEAWRVMLVSGQAQGAEQGEFRRFEPQTGHFYPIPFSELLQETGWRREASKPRTAVRWTHYRTARPVSHLDPSVVADPSTKTQPSRERELDLGGFLRALRPKGERPLKGDTVSAAETPSPRGRTPFPAVPPARRPNLNGPISPSPGRSAARRIDAAPQAQEPTRPPAPAEPMVSAPSHLSISRRTSDVPVAPAPDAPTPLPAPPAAAARAPVPPAAVPPAAEPPARGTPTRVTPAPAPLARLPAAAVPPAPVPVAPVPDLEVPQIFINGALIALPDTVAPLTALPPPHSLARRLLTALLGVALIALVGLAIYLSFR